ncbi:hypothetical protein A0H81_08864 [Grifola frondosa]|uniref:Prolyl 4-hydroxylase alpha subunit Fe(2+) 2OG dioxygenase domain-containing protein n=1 Tax=Grifola frondosa TaxID=5627 RepID=A0A1C7M327_GRIFR|nr:hypothetical protein A0H81_08864 [Grifola frondosa]
MPIPGGNFVLYYGKGYPAGRVNLLNASNKKLEYLARACDPATFGVARKDVLDETYRKVGKLDAAHFAIQFDLERSGLAGVIRSGLLEGHDEKKAISAELYKLNVYGKGSFFKAHKDTPRSKTMFGSLVIVFPTPHEGGALSLRHNGDEWVFDSSKILADEQEPRIAYIAFYSDVEHEVALVTSGYRVTITYNLYFASPLAAEVAAAHPLSAYESDFKSVFQALLDEPTFLADGGHLGFGLRHQYPIPWTDYESHSLVDLAHCLKGSDAVLMKVCRELRLDASLKMAFEDRMRSVVVMCNRAINFDGAYLEEPISYFLRANYGGKNVSYLDYSSPGLGLETLDMEVCWVTERTNFNRVESTYIAYGNEPCVEYAYGDICLVVQVEGFGSRVRAAM